jgi:hypothetical protein
MMAAEQPAIARAAAFDAPIVPAAIRSISRNRDGDWPAGAEIGG